MPAPETAYPAIERRAWVESRPRGEFRLDGAGKQLDRIVPNAAVDLPRGELRGADECFSGLGAVGRLIHAPEMPDAHTSGPSAIPH